MNTEQIIARELGIREGQVKSAVSLIDEGNTIPFIARYRKEATGELTDSQLRTLYDRLLALRALDERRSTVLRSVEEQGALTEELKAKLEKATTLAEIEDLYMPYRPKRRTRASIAAEKGLVPLAEYILKQDPSSDIEREASGYVTPPEKIEETPEEKRVLSAEEAITGAMDILAERFSDDALIRGFARQATAADGIIVSAEKKKPDKTKDSVEEDGNAVKGAKNIRRDVYEMYFSYTEPVKSIPGHRILAIDRGEKEGVLSVSMEAPVQQILDYMKGQLLSTAAGRNPAAQILEDTIADSYKRLIAPSIERGIRSDMTDRAQEKAIEVFKKNLEQLLMQPPVQNRRVLGWDPGYRTGCKIAVVDETGKLLDHTVVYPVPPHNKVNETKTVIKGLIKKHGVTLVALGNGTASGESELVVADILRELASEDGLRDISYTIVNEAGASVYSASELASEEFPGEDVGTRSAVSMARRLQDPLAELVKIDPKALGVGQYQHDMNQKRLEEALTGVVEDCVNRVGCDLNTASYSLLSYISGISAPMAKKIVGMREKNGAFRNRRELLKVPGLGAKTFEQCSGFLRITGGDEPLDATAVHPENYKAVTKLLSEIGMNSAGATAAELKLAGSMVKEISAVAARIGVGEATLKDILAELQKPGRDPREELTAPLMQQTVLLLEELQPGMKLKGTVRNIVDFGAFVDIGVHQDGLVHISQLADRFVKDPMEVVHVGDIVDVTVLSVDPAKKRISLTMKKNI